ncbi:hypothetical protein BU17DRAFT_69963 [Hysterangium stoloniferum]|nr:hypothetical protein BU17DRAFT_69963 [Hysterangium stoloniferum]
MVFGKVTSRNLPSNCSPIYSIPAQVANTYQEYDTVHIVDGYDCGGHPVYPHTFIIPSTSETMRWYRVYAGINNKAQLDGQADYGDVSILQHLTILPLLIFRRYCEDEERWVSGGSCDRLDMIVVVGGNDLDVTEKKRWSVPWTTAWLEPWGTVGCKRDVLLSKDKKNPGETARLVVGEELGPNGKEDHAATGPKASSCRWMLAGNPRGQRSELGYENATFLLCGAH